ncbi:MAG: hypothetical protein AAGH41_12405 [Pseudomonadota bacterium]
MKLGIVCGLKSERAVLSGVDAQFFISGANAQRAREGAAMLVSSGIEALVSFGISGAVRPGLEPGTLLLPDTIMNDDGECFQTSELPGVGVPDPAFGSDALITSAAAKAQLSAHWGVASVDMESHAVADAARAARLPLYVLRAIADTAEQSLPPSAQGAVRPDGSINTLKTLIGLFRRPQDLAKLMTLGRQSAAGHEALRREGRRLIEELAER